MNPTAHNPIVAALLGVMFFTQPIASHLMQRQQEFPLLDLK